MSDSRTLFSGRADHYVKGRPGYSPALLDFFRQELGFAPGKQVADVGSGTGKLSRLLLEQGLTVYCVEPNGDMRAAAARQLSDFPHCRQIEGEAAHTGLEAQSVDFITAAQAFHWFDPAAFRRESLRILRPGGVSVLVWSRRREDDPAHAACKQVFARYCPNYRGFSNGFDPEGPAIGLYFDGRFEKRVFDDPLTYTRDTFFARCLSSSYALKPGDRDYAPYMAALQDIFDRFAKDGRLTMGNENAAYWGTL